MTPVLLSHVYRTVRVYEDYSWYVVDTYPELQNTVPVNPSGIILRLLIFRNTNNSEAAVTSVIIILC